MLEFNRDKYARRWDRLASLLRDGSGPVHFFRPGLRLADAAHDSLAWVDVPALGSAELTLHWRAPGLFLARQFLDFEAGIHWSQMQMQSGTTGINTLRIYSPAKQQRDHDPGLAYVRRWVPELGTAAYPAPVVDERAALAHAKERLYGLRRTADARAEADVIQQRHGSRRSGLPPGGRRGKTPRTAPAPAPASVQPDLFADLAEHDE